MAHLFETLTIRSLSFRNRIVVSPMCQYSSIDGLATDWHLVHLGSRAVGGAGLILTEAAAVLPEGRISPDDLGIWNDAQGASLAPLVRFIEAQGCVAGMQLAHAGRKASTDAPWRGSKPLGLDSGGWQPIYGPSPLAFSPDHQTPQALDRAGIQEVVSAFRDAAQRALAAGMRVLEIHAAHGYLLHEFLSPLSNRREDEYGGSFENRISMICETASAIRSLWPESLPLFVRLSCTDWLQGGWDLEQSIELARRLKSLGVDLIDCSSGGLLPHVRIPVGPGYQAEFAERIRREADVLTCAVGMITAPQQADHVVRSGQADMVMLARELLRNPYWPLHAARELGQDVAWPAQYERAKQV